VLELEELEVRVGIKVRVRVRVRDAKSAKHLGTKKCGYEVTESPRKSWSAIQKVPT